jgi:hypothetical protein
MSPPTTRRRKTSSSWGGEEDVDIEVEEASDRRTSGSMSSLGHPIPSRYPFQYRRPRGGSSLSSQSRSHVTPQSYNSRSTPSRSTQSTGNAETSDSPWSADNSSPRSHDSAGIPMPPRHPNVQQRRGRAGTVPALLASPTPAYHRTRRGQGQKVVARRVLRTTPHQFTSPVKKMTMMRSGASKLLNPKGLSRRLRERTALGCSQLVPVLELP